MILLESWRRKLKLREANLEMLNLFWGSQTTLRFYGTPQTLSLEKCPSVCMQNICLAASRGPHILLRLLQNLHGSKKNPKLGSETQVCPRSWAGTKFVLLLQ